MCGSRVPFSFFCSTLIFCCDVVGAWSRMHRLVRTLLFIFLIHCILVLFTLVLCSSPFPEDIILDLTLKFGFQRESMRNVVSTLYTQLH